MVKQAAFLFLRPFEDDAYIASARRQLILVSKQPLGDFFLIDCSNLDLAAAQEPGVHPAACQPPYEATHDAPALIDPRCLSSRRSGLYRGITANARQAARLNRNGCTKKGTVIQQTRFSRSEHEEPASISKSKQRSCPLNTSTYLTDPLCSSFACEHIKIPFNAELVALLPSVGLFDRAIVPLYKTSRSGQLSSCHHSRCLQAMNTPLSLIEFKFVGSRVYGD